MDPKLSYPTAVYLNLEMTAIKIINNYIILSASVCFIRTFQQRSTAKTTGTLIEQSITLIQQSDKNSKL